jgi:hypothetical protein
MAAVMLAAAGVQFWEAIRVALTRRQELRASVVLYIKLYFCTSHQSNSLIFIYIFIFGEMGV